MTDNRRILLSGDSSGIGLTKANTHNARGALMDMLGLFRMFCRVVELGSFSKVGRERGISQAAVSRQMANMEEFYGVRVFHRTTRKLALTEEGQALLPHARSMIAAFDAAQDAVVPKSKAISGVVHVGVPVALGVLLSSRMRALLERHPNLSIDISIGECFGDLIEEGFDVVVTIGNLSDSAFVARHIGSTRRILVASPSYIERRGEPLYPDDLTLHDCITYPGEGTTSSWRFSGPDGEKAVSVGSRFRANSSDIVRRVVLDGLGIGLLPEGSVASELGQDKVRVLMAHFSPVQYPVYIQYPSKENLPARTRAVINFLVEEFESNPALADGV